MKGIRVVPEAKERDRFAFAFMSNDISSERQVETAVEQTAAIVRQVRREGKKIVAVAGPVVVHTGGVEALSRLIRDAWIDVLLAGNALAVHDIEAAYPVQPMGHLPLLPAAGCLALVWKKNLKNNPMQRAEFAPPRAIG